MTPQSRLAEIRKRMEAATVDHNSENGLQDKVISDCLDDLAFLIARVTSLEKALEKIGHRHEPEAMDNKDQILGYLLCCEDIIQEARKALIGEEHTPSPDKGKE